MKIEQLAKWLVGSVFALGAAVVVINHQSDVVNFMQGSANALVSFGKGVAQIGS